MRKPLILAVVAALVLGVLGAVAPEPAPTPAAAVTAADWNAGFIISDEQFYDGAAMTAGEVQAFLNARVPVCDTWRQTIPSNPQPPYTCLKDYVQATPAMAATKYCGAIPASGGRTAAEIIAVVGAACSISQKSLIVLLQKEQSLITDTWPWPIQYQKATGFSCPDTAPCDPAYANFFYQVYYGARMFQRYRLDPQDFNFRAGGTYQILWSPNNCGSGQVTIQNAATAGLYNYTPYQPNAASLANLYGTGDVCSTYGNRNFWRLWWDWFGDPRTAIGLPGTTVDRIGGADRYQTSALLSQAAFPTAGVPVAYVATGQNYPDALAAAPAAVNDDGPLILVGSTSLPAASAAELQRLKPQRIIVVGGTPSVSDAVFEQLRPFAVTGQIERVEGPDRYTTSLLLAQRSFTDEAVSKVLVTTGDGYPDAISASTAGGLIGAPVILVPGGSAQVSQQTVDTIASFGSPMIVVIGGPNTVSESILGQLAAIGPTVRIAGSDRSETSKLLTEFAFSAAAPSKVYLSTNYNYPDALTGAVLATSQGAALITVPPWCVPPTTTDYVRTLVPIGVTLLGDGNSLGSGVARFSSC